MGMGPDTEYALIPLTKGQFATVDLLDCGAVSRYKWQAYFDKSTRTFYARTSIPNGRSQRTLGMHRFIAGDPTGKMVDHRNRSPLDNRQRNLRVCSERENSWNRIHRSSAPFPGIQQLRSGKWRARVRVNGKISGHLGVFETADLAAAAVSQARRQQCGEFTAF